MRPAGRGFSCRNPKGIVSSSPGLRGTSYPGNAVRRTINPNGVAAPSVERKPKVARASQPWALRRNPIGILPPERLARPAICSRFTSPQLSRKAERNEKSRSASTQRVATWPSGFLICLTKARSTSLRRAGLRDQRRSWSRSRCDVPFYRASVTGRV